MNIKTKTLITLIGMVFSVSAFATKGGITIEGKSDYICNIDFKDTTVFTGEVFTNGQSLQIFFIKGKEVIKIVYADTEQLPVGEARKKLDDSIAVSVSLLDEVPSKNEKALLINIGRVNWSQEEILSNSSMASGLHKGFVILADEAKKIKVNCFHKSIL